MKRTTTSAISSSPPPRPPPAKFPSVTMMYEEEKIQTRDIILLSTEDATDTAATTLHHANKNKRVRMLREIFSLATFCLASIVAISSICLFVGLPSYINQRVLGLGGSGDEERQLSQQEEDTDVLSAESPARQPRGPINFLLESNAFIQTVTDCFADDHCKILYYHFGKTGGSDMETKMFHAFPTTERIPSCCNDVLMKNFTKTPEKYCRSKFSSYQVRKGDFLNRILPTCMRMTQSRAVVLASFREPIQRSLSYIHQRCNKYLHKRTPETVQACQRCSYEQDREYWDNTTREFNDEYQELLDVVTAGVPNTTVLTIDSVDLSAFYEMLHTSVPGKGFNRITRSNPEKKSLCSFGFTSDMMRGLRLSSEVYRSLTLNRL